MLKCSTAIVLAALVVLTSIADAREFRRRNNPPGPAGGRGTNWWLGNPPGRIGGRGAGPRWRNRVVPNTWVYWGAHDGWHWYKHPNGYWCMFDNDGNPPGPAGGPGTNWENPPGPIGGPGASPNSPYRPC
jgi:hypothetical protein